MQVIVSNSTTIYNRLCSIRWCNDSAFVAMIVIIQNMAATIQKPSQLLLLAKSLQKNLQAAPAAHESCQHKHQ